jgi:hypothetical protein
MNTEKVLKLTDNFSVTINTEEVKELNENDKYSCFNEHKEEGKYFCWVILQEYNEILKPKESFGEDYFYDKVEHLKEKVKNTSQLEIADIMYRRFILKENEIKNVSDFSYEGMILDFYDMLVLDENFNYIFHRRTNC